MRSRARSLPRARWRSIARSPPPADDPAGPLPQFLDESLHSGLPTAENLGLLDLALQERHDP